MKRYFVFGMSLAVALTSFLADGPRLSITDSYAKPPDWAPAHGYRRKHEGKQEKHKDYDREDRDDWKEKLEDQMEERFPGYKVFVLLDQDRSGSISRQEWNEGDDLFIILDRDGNGRLSRAEYSRVEEERGFLGNILAKVKEKVTGFFASLF